MMAANEMWISPDERITKVIVIPGKIGLKPIENCECVIDISSTTYDVQKYNKIPFVIGDSCDSFERLLDIVLTMMGEGEKAKITFKLKEREVQFILELKTFKSNGFIFEWNAKKKLELSSKHKVAGVELFKETLYVDASHRFSKAIKLLASILIPVDEPVSEIDGISLSEIYLLKSILYNNLASCYIKHGDYETVIELCQKVLKADTDNIKALYKLAVAYYELHNYDTALDVLKTVLKLDPENKAAADKHKDFVKKVNESNAKVNAMIKKMFI